MQSIKKGLVLLLIFALAAPCLSACSNGTAAARRDENLQLELKLSKSVYASNEPIECRATLSYIGEADSFTFYSGEPVVMFAIGGGKYFNGQKDLLHKGLYERIIEKDRSLDFPFKKYKGNHSGTDKDAVAFWKEFLSTDELLLEPGTYKIYAEVFYVTALDDANRLRSTITVQKAITVK